MCGEQVPTEHSHVADLEQRGILCACRACYLLFTNQGAGRGRFRAIPDRYRYDPAFVLDEATWDSIGIPVRMAFFLGGSTVAFYPSPAGATESLLPLDDWERVMAANPRFADVAEDVEALLVVKNDDGFECFLVPIDECYRLVGLVKLRWKGFSGGEEAWEAIEGFFAGLRERCGG
jgi:hypothetical protein